MSKNVHWSPDDLRKKGLVANEKGDYVKAESLVNKGTVKKIEPSVTEFQQRVIDRVKNKKVLNAVKSEVDGVKFDSNLERFMYGLLKGAGIEFEFQKVYLLQEKFRYNGDAVRAITLTVDFWIPSHNIIIDTKGYANDVAPLKYKMLKSYLKHIEDNQPEICLPSNKKECELLLNKILYG